MLRSPLYDHLKSLGAEFVEEDGWLKASFVDSNCGVALRDLSHRRRLRVEGPGAAAAVATTKLTPGESASRKMGLVLCSRPDLFFVLGGEGEPQPKKNKPAVVVDITQGTAEILVDGPRAVVLMSRVCGLDFAEFAEGSLKTTSVAKTTQHVYRIDGGFHLIGNASLAEYLWKTLSEAGHDLELAPR